MKKIMEYKGYRARVEFDTDNSLLFGKIEGISDLVTFESKNLSETRKEFEEAVDGYLEFCKEVGKKPDKEYKGTFNVRISPKLHKELAVLAYENDESLNQSVEKAIQFYVDEMSQASGRLHETYVKVNDLAYKKRQKCTLEEKNAERDVGIRYGKYKIKNIEMQYKR